MRERARPRHQPVEPPPDPHSLVENLQHQLVDIPGTEQPAIRPPWRRTDFVETVGGFHREAMGFEQLARFAASCSGACVPSFDRGSRTNAGRRAPAPPARHSASGWSAENPARGRGRPGTRAHSGKAPYRSGLPGRPGPPELRGRCARTATLGVRRKRLRKAWRCSGSFSAAM